MKATLPILSQRNLFTSFAVSTRILRVVTTRFTKAEPFARKKYEPRTTRIVRRNRRTARFTIGTLSHFLTPWLSFIYP